MTLQEKTLELLKNRSIKLTMKQICQEANLTEGWLAAFSNNTIKEPSANKVQRLYEYLSNTKLFNS